MCRARGDKQGSEEEEELVQSGVLVVSRGDSVICHYRGFCTHDLIFCFFKLRVSFRRKSKKDKEAKDSTKEDQKVKESTKGKKDKDEVRSRHPSLLVCFILSAIFRRGSLVCPTWLYNFPYSVPVLRDFSHDL